MPATPWMVLIGPAAAGKSTLGKLLAAMTGRPFIDLDACGETYYSEAGWTLHQLAARIFEVGRRAAEQEWEPARVHAVERVVAEHPGAIIALGAGHSHYDQPGSADRVRTALRLAEQVVLVLPSADSARATDVLRERCRAAKGTDWTGEDGDLLRAWVDSPSNRQLATMVIATEGEDPEQTAARLLDDVLVGTSTGSWWSEFYSSRARPIPFLVDWPDESLAGWFAAGQLAPGRVLELGCGHGRNAVYLASQGCQVDAVDFSAEAIEWATERAAAATVAVSFQCCSIFDVDFRPGTYDLVYDSGCFHHLAPHRRNDYVELVSRALKPGGAYGLTCFRPEGGSGLSDWEVYERRGLGGGLGYSREQLLEVWADRLEIVELRQMIKTADDARLMGEDFLWVLLARKPAA